MSDRDFALRRLAVAIYYCTDSGAFDQEEQDHLMELLRIIEENVPWECFAGFGDFKGPGR